MYAKPRIYPADRSGRAANSAARIQGALLECIADGPFETVTVAALADRAGLARSTIYRKFADVDEILWCIAAPLFLRGLRTALVADRVGFRAAGHEMWRTQGLVAALASSEGRATRSKLSDLASAEVQRATRRRDARACGMVLSGAWFSLLEGCRCGDAGLDDALSELATLIYVGAYLTPEGLGALAQRHSSQIEGCFPAAVSIQESLADETHIVSMIDGRRYRCLTRHIARFGMSPDDYRRCFALPTDYPMSAKSYSARRRQLATDLGLGRRPQQPTPRQRAAVVRSG